VGGFCWAFGYSLLDLLVCLLLVYFDKQAFRLVKLCTPSLMLNSIVELFEDCTLMKGFLLHFSKPFDITRILLEKRVNTP
jgi:hypothetical protein